MNSVPIDPEFLCDPVWSELAVRLVPEWEVEITIADLSTTRWAAGCKKIGDKRAEILIDVRTLLKRPRKVFLRTFLHELGHIRLTTGKTFGEVDKLFKSSIEPESGDAFIRTYLTKYLKADSDKQALLDESKREAIADWQRDRWIEEGELDGI